MSALILDEHFAAATLDARLHWLNPPECWRLDPHKGVLVVEPKAETDFWQRTQYGFRADNGHFLGLEVAGDFDLSTQVAFRAVHQYDQAGLMIRASADCWVKTSVEHELDGPPQLGVVVTNSGYSDWSLQDLPLAVRESLIENVKPSSRRREEGEHLGQLNPTSPPPHVGGYNPPHLGGYDSQTSSEIRLRLCRRGGDVTAEFGAPLEAGWKPMRVAHWQAPANLPLLCGLYACSPKGAGFRAEFKFLRVEKA